jgi:hypothetical protein
MCFEIYGKAKPKPEKATEDIIVYKAIQANGKGVYNQMIIDNKATRWRKGNEYYETTPFKTMTKSKWSDRWDINGHAFHSGVTKYDADFHVNRDRGDIVVKMIIPKGALYYKSNTEYVSNRIIYPRYKI